ncbi:hypothetical protein PILCRDRAFT_12475 [Piloderma croceum F 1598]|uniref:Myb/SANT-like domain-containing protein n=1 Tax=Piloderma croceum (strain F 1598) TaxID=765440 RepID=A0A0C3ASP1_PILCF|nr:hypothetical protein PILCRDRAFT_12475 [Piloderma croceum F 1598]
MANLSQEEKANWNEPETVALVNYFWEHRAEGGDGGTFKDTAFNAVATHIAHLWTSGPVKTAKKCKTKYNGLKTIFRAIVTYKDTTSGSHWDNVKGANIEGEAALATWNNYINASKSNKPMAAFRTKGWLYFDKFQDIIPNASARGGNAFSAMHTAPPIPLNDTLDLDVLDEGAKDEMSTDDNNAFANPMDVDQHDTTSIFSSKAAGKCKLDVIASDEETGTVASEDAIPSSSRLSTSIASAEPAKKKITPSTSLVSSSKSLPKSSKASSSARSSWPSRAQPSSSKQTSAKLSPALLVHEMQGSINSLATAVRESGATDPVAKLRQEAVHHVSVGDDGLSGLDKITIIELFRTDYASVQTYLALLQHDDIRKQWLIKRLQD